MHLGLPDASGRMSVDPIEGSSFTVPADLVIKALGFDPEDMPEAFNEPGLKLTGWGTLKTNPKTFDQPARRIRRAATSCAAPPWSSGPSATAVTPPPPSIRHLLGAKPLRQAAE